MRWHPDRSDDPDAGDKFAKISESYRILSDTQHKRDYDRWIEEVKRQASGSAPPVQHYNDGSVWSKGVDRRPLRSTDYHDKRAEAFHSKRRTMAGDPFESAASSQSSSKWDFNQAHYRGQYSSPQDPSWHKARQQEREEHGRVQVRRQFLIEDRFKFVFAAALLVGILVLNMRGRNDNSDK